MMPIGITGIVSLVKRKSDELAESYEQSKLNKKERE
jgi:hypothetical protein